MLLPRMSTPRGGSPWRPSSSAASRRRSRRCRRPRPRYTGDLPVLQERGVLRVIVPPEPVDHLPRYGEPVTLDYDVARGLSGALRLEAGTGVKAQNFAEMMTKLLQGEGDIVAASLTITPERQEKAAFSLPYLHVDEYLVTKAGEPDLPAAVEDLAGMEIGVRRSSSHYRTLLEIQRQVPSLRIHEAPEQLGMDLLVEGVVRGDYGATVSDEHIWRGVANHYPEHGHTPGARREPPHRPDDAAHRHATEDERRRLPARPAVQPPLPAGPSPTTCPG